MFQDFDCHYLNLPFQQRGSADDQKIFQGKDTIHCLGTPRLRTLDLFHTLFHVFDRYPFYFSVNSVTFLLNPGVPGVRSMGPDVSK